MASLHGRNDPATVGRKLSAMKTAMSPPLIVEKSHIDDMVSILGDAIKRVA